MHKCNDCGRYLINNYDKCPGCGSSNLVETEYKENFMIDTPPSNGYLLVKALIEEQLHLTHEKANRRTGYLVIALMVALLLVISVFILLSIDSNTSFSDGPGVVLTFVSFIIGLCLLFTIISLFIPTRKKKLINLYKKGILYKNVPYKVEDFIDNLKYRSVTVFYKEYQENKKFRCPVDIDSQMIEDEGHIDLIVYPNDWSVFIMAEDIY